ncbi:MAG: response regulator [Sedimentisphaerales bacterium]|nr:response regulator [Sedimentisphaerales bacterium]
MNDEQTSVRENQSYIVDKGIIKVLLVDDDEVDRRLARRILVESSQQVRFAVEPAGSLSEAVEYLGKNECDVVLLDLGLPDSKGFETVLKIQEVNAQVPIVVLTGLSDETAGVTAIKNGATDYLIKGVSLENLLIRTILYAIERKKTGEKIKKVAREWRTTFDSISDMVSIHDADFKIVRVNKAFAEAFNTEPKELIGKTCYEVLHNTKQPCPNCPHGWTLKTKKPASLEFYEPQLGIHLGVSTSPMFDEKGEVVGSVHIAKDITERKLAEESLKKANETLKEYNQLKDEFVSTASHELRTPLSIIQGSIKIVLDEIPGEINAEQKEVLTMARENVERLGRIVNSLLDMSKIEAGKLTLNKTVVNICELIKNTVSEYQVLTQEKNIGLDCEVPEISIDICIDSDRIKQVLINLISNSLKFTPEQGWIKVTCDQRDGEVFISVQDSGVGIAEEDIPKLFDKFTQFGRKDGPGAKGTGLGLTITKKLVELHEGNIKVESEINKGTTFIISLPLTTEAAAENLHSVTDELVENTLAAN